ncbi:MAG: hypothetical protein KDD61_07015, partial [Bdellovibrionales bacterium]|nr:hypothetical protein [Bdellovibrionales bacterium]
MSILPWLHRSLSLILALSLTQLGQAALYYNDGESLPGGKIASWSSDSGLNPNNPLDRELLDIYATQYPFMPGYSKELLGKDKFRGDFGPTLWRAVLEQFQIIGMGQDATHIAEASGRTATAGFGGRVTQFMEYFGAVNGVWLNAFANTIKGQYGAYGSPIVYFDNKGQPQVKYTGFVDTPLWMMSQDLTSPMVEARNNIIEWILRKSLDNEQRGSTSAKLFALFGGAARDAMASFIISRGGKVGTRTSEVQAKKTQVPEMKLMYAGGNNEFPVPLNKEGKDLYQELAKKYEGRRLNYKKAEDQSLAQNLLRKHLSEVLGEMAFTYGGPNRNGMIHAAQLGGYDLWNVEINGEKTISLKGLRLSDGTTIKHDILFVQFPHPSALSRMSKEDASSSVNKALKVLEPYAKKGWKITPEDGLRNKYAAGVPYVYGRTDIGPQNYDFGAPRNRMVPVSSAVRNGSNKITIGIRDPAKFPSEDVKAI